MEQYRLCPVGDRAVSVEFENVISLTVNQKVRALVHTLAEKKHPGLVELVPSYRALLIVYDPLTLPLRRLEHLVETAVQHLDSVVMPRELVTEIPVLYEGEYGMDLEEIARLENKTVEEVIRIHSQSDYYIYIGADSNRMGCRLDGPLVEHAGDGNIISDGIVPGCIQVSGSGQPIVLLQDCQTVGGYAKIATVVAADLGSMGQLKPGDRVRFRAVSLEEAHAAYLNQEKTLYELDAKFNHSWAEAAVHRIGQFLSGKTVL